MRSYFADIEKYLYSWFNAGDSTKVLPVIVNNMQSWLFRDQWTKTVTMSKDETDKYKTLVSNLENELKSKGEKYWQMFVEKSNCILYFPENKNSMLEAEIRSLQRRLVRRDNEILKQERELHKLRVRLILIECCILIMYG